MKGQKFVLGGYGHRAPCLPAFYWSVDITDSAAKQVRYLETVMAMYHNPRHVFSLLSYVSMVGQFHCPSKCDFKAMPSPASHSLARTVSPLCEIRLAQPQEALSFSLAVCLQYSRPPHSSHQSWIFFAFLRPFTPHQWHSCCGASPRAVIRGRGPRGR